MTVKKEVPAALQSEEAVLAALLIDKSVFPEVAPLVTQSDFYRSANGIIYKAMSDAFIADETIDPLTLVEKLRALGQLESCGGIEYIGSLIDAVPNAHSASQHAKIVREKAQRRRIIKAAENVVSNAYSHEMSKVVASSDAIISAMGSMNGGGFELMKNSLWPAFEEIEKIFSGEAADRGILTGFSELDKMLVGFQEGDLVVIAARPSMGKTAFALNFMVNVATQNIPVAMVSLEMTAKAVTVRAIASEARVDLQAVRNGRHVPNAQKRLSKAAGILSEAPLFIDDDPVSRLPELAAKLNRLVRSHGVRMVVIDYLQLMEAEGESRVQQVSALTRGLKLLAGKLQIPIVVLSQLSRQVETRKDRRPILADLRDSGSIEQDADTVMFLYRPEYYVSEEEDKAKLSGLAEIIVAKQRNGPVGRCPLHFSTSFARFDNFDRGATSIA